MISTRSLCDRYRYEGDEGPLSAPEYHNTGLYNAYRAPSSGLGSHTAKAEGVGKFLAHTLRNMAITAPYMHDGGIVTWEAMIEHYTGGRPFPVAAAPESDPKAAVIDGGREAGSE